MKYYKRKLKRRSKRARINKAIQWLKEFGVNPHISANDKGVGHQRMLKSGGAFSVDTGEIYISNRCEYKFGKDFFSGAIAHELFHRSDYLDKFYGTKKKRRERYMEWEETKEMLKEIEKHKKHMSADNPLKQARRELLNNTCNALKSMLKTWQKDPEKFKEMLKKAKELEDSLKDNEVQDKRTMDEINKVKEYFIQTPVTLKIADVFYEILSEIPAYMLYTYIIWGDVKHGAMMAKKALNYKYFRKTSANSIIKDTTRGYWLLIYSLKMRWMKDKEILRTILNLHKNICTPTDVLEFAEMEIRKRLISRSVKAIKRWKGVKDVRIAIAAHHLGEIEEIYKKVMEKQHGEKEKTKN
ncbi:hypothetical protein KKP97_02585 [Methanothermococcus sp. SCGC AD-155-C09]|nr:hypothetical protein [Methanothermococcus sp. SCGC AD-155-C09]